MKIIHIKWTEQSFRSEFEYVFLYSLFDLLFLRSATRMGVHFIECVDRNRDNILFAQNCQ